MKVLFRATKQQKKRMIEYNVDFYQIVRAEFFMKLCMLTDLPIVLEVSPNANGGESVALTVYKDYDQNLITSHLPKVSSIITYELIDHTNIHIFNEFVIHGTLLSELRKVSADYEVKVDYQDYMDMEKYIKTLNVNK